jgi:outer membrane receptor protein involved in Fe transport
MKKILLFLSMNVVLSFQFNYSQNQNVTISGSVKDKATNLALPFVNAVLKNETDSSFVAGTITFDDGLFSFSNIHPGNYFLTLTFSGYTKSQQTIFVGSLSPFLDLGTLFMEQPITDMEAVVVSHNVEEVDAKMDKKVFSVEDNISQSGGSVLQTLSNLPGITIQDGKVQLRGSDKIIILIDGKQTALTGFGNQSGLENLPASSIEKIEIINNPSSKYDANGNAGIINIILKKNKQEGWNGKVGLTGGLGSLWERKDNLPTIRPQYVLTPKINPSLSLNYRKKDINVFLQVDDLYTQTLNKNEYTTRTYDDGTIIEQQLKRNRNTNFLTSKLGLDWTISDKNSLSISGLFGSEKIIDRGDEVFFNADYSNRLRLWQFVEDELKTTVMATSNFQHKFKQAGHYYNLGFTYTFHREDERYNFDNIMPTFTGFDAFKLLSDEKVMDFNFDYVKPLKYGKLETGAKFRKRDIPTNMQFYPGLNSPLDSNAGGWAVYREIIPAVYGNYTIDRKKIEAEIGLRAEYVSLKYDVNPNHVTYKSSGYDYIQPFPTARFAYKLNKTSKLSIFYNRRVDRPNEVDIRIFPKYDDAEIIKVGNPGLRPQFTNSVELGYKKSWKTGYLYSALYHRMATGTITRISTIVPGSPLIYAIFQNAGKSYNTGLEVVFSQDYKKWYSTNVNVNVYRNQINAFTVENLYPTPHVFSTGTEMIYSGNVKWNNNFKSTKGWEGQLTLIYMAPDIIPQGTIGQRFTMNLGIKKSIQKGKGDLFFNATDVFNTLVIKRQIQGNGFRYTSTDYAETQVFRIGYSYKF